MIAYVHMTDRTCAFLFVKKPNFIGGMQLLTV